MQPLLQESAAGPGRRPRAVPNRRRRRRRRSAIVAAVYISGGGGPVSAVCAEQRHRSVSDSSSAMHSLRLVLLLGSAAALVSGQQLPVKLDGECRTRPRRGPGSVAGCASGSQRHPTVMGGVIRRHRRRKWRSEVRCRLAGSPAGDESSAFVEMHGDAG